MLGVGAGRLCSRGEAVQRVSTRYKCYFLKDAADVEVLANYPRGL